MSMALLWFSGSRRHPSAGKGKALSWRLVVLSPKPAGLQRRRRRFGMTTYRRPRRPYLSDRERNSAARPAGTLLPPRSRLGAGVVGVEGWPASAPTPSDRVGCSCCCCPQQLVQAGGPTEPSDLIIGKHIGVCFSCWPHTMCFFCWPAAPLDSLPAQGMALT